MSSEREEIKKRVQLLLMDVVHFTNSNGYDYETYKERSSEFCDSLIRLSNKNENKNLIDEVIENLEEDIQFTCCIVVDEPSILKEKKWKKNYSRIKEQILNQLSDRTPIEKGLKNLYPFKTQESVKFFDKYIDEGFIVDNYIDYSYLFQRMLREKLIERITHREFMEWLFDNQFITEKIYKSFIVKGNFYSLKKSSTVYREGNFDKIFKSN